MPKNLKRYFGRGDLHFLTFSCYRRLPELGTAQTRNEFLHALDEVRTKYGFALVGYVVMPEHVHLLMSEPKNGTPSTVVHSLKLRVSKRLRAKSEESIGAPQFWYIPAEEHHCLKSNSSTDGTASHGKSKSPHVSRIETWGAPAAPFLPGSPQPTAAVVVPFAWLQ